MNSIQIFSFRFLVFYKLITTSYLLKTTHQTVTIYCELIQKPKTKTVNRKLKFISFQSFRKCLQSGLIHLSFSKKSRYN